MKITTLQTKVKALAKLNLNDLDFQGLSADGQHTQIEPQLVEIKKELANFSRRLRNQEKKYLQKASQERLNNIFGKLLDQCDGDAQKALTALEASVNAVAAQKHKVNNVAPKAPNNVKTANNAQVPTPKAPDNAQTPTQVANSVAPDETQTANSAANQAAVAPKPAALVRPESEPVAPDPNQAQ